WRMPAIAARPWLMTYRYHSESGCPEGGSALANSTILKGSLLQTNLLAGAFVLLMGLQHTLISPSLCANLADAPMHSPSAPVASVAHDVQQDVAQQNLVTLPLHYEASGQFEGVDGRIVFGANLLQKPLSVTVYLVAHVPVLPEFQQNRAVRPVLDYFLLHGCPLDCFDVSAAALLACAPAPHVADHSASGVPCEKYDEVSSLSVGLVRFFLAQIPAAGRRTGLRSLSASD